MVTVQVRGQVRIRALTCREADAPGGDQLEVDQEDLARGAN